MTETALAFLALAWPPAAAWIVIKLVPGSISKYIDKEIERRSSAKLERFKAEIQGAYSSVRSSVDVLSASNSGMRPHIVESVSSLWSTMTAMRERFGGVVAFDSVILADEAQEMFGEGINTKALRYVRRFEDSDANDRDLLEFNAASLEQHRLFCGDKLWLIFYIYRAILLRAALLITRSFERSGYQDWRLDNGMKQLMASVFTADEVVKFQVAKFGGLMSALSQLETEFLHEATRVMSGSKAMSDSLSDMQAMIALQDAQAAGTGNASDARNS